MNEYLTDRLGREGVSFIGRNRDRPFFLYLAFHAPHGPIQTIDRYYRRFPGIANETQRIYAAMISALDDWVGAVLAELRRHGLEDRTLVIFTSDNGAAKTSDIDGRRNFPLIGHKRNLYEGGIRVPYVLQWKGRVPGGARYGHAVSSLDIFPTALDAAGADADRYGPDGVSLLPHLLGERDGPPHASLVWRSGPNAAVRRGPWKLLVSGKRAGEALRRAGGSGRVQGPVRRSAGPCPRPAADSGGLGEGQGGAKAGRAQGQDEAERRRDGVAHLRPVRTFSQERPPERGPAPSGESPRSTRPTGRDSGNLPVRRVRHPPRTRSAAAERGSSPAGRSRC